MEFNWNIIIIIAVCIFVLLIGVMKNKMEWLLNILIRTIFSLIGIYFLNILMTSLGVSAIVGINSYTALTCGILGFPGVAVLYGFVFYKSL